jgi:DNA polymerase-3 subunit epsilon
MPVPVCERWTPTSESRARVRADPEASRYAIVVSEWEVESVTDGIGSADRVRAAAVLPFEPDETTAIELGTTADLYVERGRPLDVALDYSDASIEAAEEMGVRTYASLCRDLARPEMGDEMSEASNQFGAGFAVIDLETTGLFPGGHDRVVEIGIVALDPSRRPVAEWTTLVNPCRDVGPTRIHGITASQVADAPLFAEIIGDVAACVGDRIIVGHNVRFDLGFLDAEFRLGGYPVEWVPGLCTMWLASSITGARRLDECCECFGIDTGLSHSALCDARATATLFNCCLERGGRPRQVPPPMPRRSLPAIPPSGRSLVRGVAPAMPRTSLASLLGRLPNESLPSGAGREAALAYVDLLDRVLEDRVLTADEVTALAELAARWGIGAPVAGAIHRAYFSNLARLALADGVLTEVERDDLVIVAGLLGVPDALDDLRAAASAPALGVNRATELRGRTVCFTGESVCSIRGVRLERCDQQALAARAGLVSVDSVTKRLDILVLADPSSMSGKAKKADQFGIRKMAERAFWADLGVRVD